MRQVALPKLFFVDMVVDIDSFFPHITPQFLDELSRHACTPQMGREPVTAAMRAEMILHAFGVGIVQSYLLSRFSYRQIYSIPAQSSSLAIDEQRFRSFFVASLPSHYPSMQNYGGLIVEEYYPVGPFWRGLELILCSTQSMSSTSSFISSLRLIPVFASKATTALSLKSSVELMSLAISSMEMSLLIWPSSLSFRRRTYRLRTEGTGLLSIYSSYSRNSYSVDRALK